MDAPISRVFFPCGHIICCATCAERVEECSICRKPIELRHPCFLPWNADEDLENIMHSSSRRSRRLSAKSELDHPESSSSSVFMPHTASAPTCNLFCPPSTNCLTLTISDPVTGRLPSEAAMAQTNVNSSEEPADPHAPSSSEGSTSHTPTVTNTPVHACASSKTSVSNPENHSSVGAASDINIQRENPLSNPEPRANSPRRPSVHVTWQTSTWNRFLTTSMIFMDAQKGDKQIYPLSFFLLRSFHFCINQSVQRFRFIRFVILNQPAQFCGLSLVSTALENLMYFLPNSYRFWQRNHARYGPRRNISSHIRYLHHTTSEALFPLFFTQSRPIAALPVYTCTRAQIDFGSGFSGLASIRGTVRC